jgi:hypothetical protein
VGGNHSRQGIHPLWLPIAGEFDPDHSKSTHPALNEDSRDRPPDNVSGLQVLADVTAPEMPGIRFRSRAAVSSFFRHARPWNRSGGMADKGAGTCMTVWLQGSAL